MGAFLRWIRAGTFSKGELVGYVALVIVGTIMLREIVHDRDAAAEAAYQAFVLRQDADMLAVAQEINASFVQLYQGLRTIARLPAIRALGVGSPPMSGDALTSAQEIYNNLATNLSVSELYVIAGDFDPDLQGDGLDHLRKPLITFDQLIVGQNADVVKHKHAATEPVVEEIETFEYRAMKRQIELFRDRFGRESQIEGLSYPAVSSEEVITCDNSRYAPSAPNDNDRKGIVYSLPYYGHNGNFAGIVSGVVLTSVLGEHLRDNRYALRNDKLNIAIRPTDMASVVSQQAGGSSKSTSSHRYSKVSNLSFADIESTWVLSSDVDFQLHSLPEMRAMSYGVWGKSFALFSVLIMLAAALRWHSDRQVAIAAINVDLENRISERTDALAEAKRDAEMANAEKSRFLARISHEIRTPLHAIMSASELIGNEGRSDDAAAKIEIIKSSGRMLADLVNQVLDLSSIEQGRIELVLEPFSPEELARTVCNLLQSSANQKNISLTQQALDPVAGAVVADPRLVRQALVNLIGNAVKYTDKGQVTLVTSTRSHADQRMVYLQYDVIDTGRGISTDRFGQLFQPFQRDPEVAWRSCDSTGLGLSIAKNLVELMGGKLSFKSEVGVGSTFSFVVPVLRSDVTQESAVSCEPFKKDIGAYIILAEDNSQMQFLTGQLLTELGCRFVIAQDGLEVYDLLQQRQFDLVLMDCAMPRLNGLDATKLIRERENNERLRAIPVIALTANAFDENAVACREAGMTDFLSKPFSAQDLRVAIERCLARG